MGVVCAEGQLFVADTYNNKIKSIALPTLSVRTLAGSGAADHRGGTGAEACFDEPAGLSYAGGRLFIADTNNHAIRILRPGDECGLDMDASGHGEAHPSRW